MPNETTTQDYKQIVDSGRDGRREPPETQFPKIAAAWNAYLSGRIGAYLSGQLIAAKDVGWLMVIFKAIRESAAHDPDNLIDAHGYLYCTEKVEKAERLKPPTAAPIPEADGRTRIYIAGPMRGIRLFNFPAFDETAKMILALGVGQPISPADIDRAVGFDPTTLPKDYDWNKIPPGLNLREIIDRDIAALKTCHSIYLLKGWEKSTGARAEVALAKWLGLDFVVEYGAKKP